eukprot:1741805-Amphidinium_carterae.1
MNRVLTIPESRQGGKHTQEHVKVPLERQGGKESTQTFISLVPTAPNFATSAVLSAQVESAVTSRIRCHGLALEWH